MDDDRLNSPSSSAVTLEVLGHRLHIAQDPNSKHLGTTVWDASMVFVKYLEKNCRKGRFSPSKLKGKRVIELGAGCGLAGLGMALLGCDVITTDQVEVLPLLMRNVERNTSWILQANSDSANHFMQLLLAQFRLRSWTGEIKSTLNLLDLHLITLLALMLFIQSIYWNH
ncbi:protein N-lysine methyltransferase METTL21A-like isoform X2 [Ananas comosus]|uniref:Protein N-lysine methyltransferase METTL21A-like isoform X2 n=1 Tax=Ananas comosus TaxID=4615 RepID=A0A6P5EXQ5_ANACO|nr:protein N-lysine methyltransferase METTL21A-like isoform X2 [Ananas comosus]XP_020088597.1 protein N-lysine methyltransferase METTL21A-like isoform X2 [Ananas comosus]